MPPARQTNPAIVNTVTAPGAGANLLVVPKTGLITGAYYLINLKVYIDGTATGGASGDADNAFFKMPAGESGNILVPASGAVVSYDFVVYNDGISTGANIFVLQAIRAGTATAVYHAGATVTLDSEPE
jgi:hypothetical protein